MGDLGSIPGLGRSPGEGNGYPLQYSGLENSMNRGTWQAIVHGAAKSRTQLSDSHFTSLGLGVQTESWQRLTEFCQENTLIITNTSSNNTRYNPTQGHHQMVNTEIRLIIFFTAKDGEALTVSKNKAGS